MTTVVEKNGNKGAAVVKPLDFDNIPDAPREIQARRPMLKWKKLADPGNANTKFVVGGWLLGAEYLPNPKGASRKEDGFWVAIVELTHPCKAVDGDEIVTAQPGTEVYVPFGKFTTDLGKQLSPMLGKKTMFWVAIRPDGEIPTANNPMRKFKVKPGEKGELAPQIREGRYLVYLAPAANVPSLPAGTTEAEHEAARAEVPFS
jgi:hypothetical protein